MKFKMTPLAQSTLQNDSDFMNKIEENNLVLPPATSCVL